MLVNPYIFGVSAGGGLIDGFTTGLLGAWGLAKLVGAYAGSAIRVRRSSDDTESDIGFSAGTLDTAALLAFTGSANAYANYASVGVYLKPEGSSGSTAFRCRKGHTCTSVGNVQVSTTLGFPTALFDGSGDRIDLLVNRSTQIGSGAVRIRCKIRAASLKVAVIAEGWGGSAAASIFYFQLGNGSGRIEAGFYSGGSVVGACSSANGVISTGITYDVEFGRDGSGNCQLSVDGVSVATATTSATINAGPTTLYVGGESGDASVSFDGHIWGLSFEPGVAAHTGSFTPDALYSTDGDGYVVKVYDQSGGSIYLGQATDVLQPRIVDNATALPDMHFDGADDYLQASSSSGTPAAITIFYTGKFRTDTQSGDNWLSMQLPFDFNNGHGCYLAVGHNDGIGWGVSDGTGNRLTAQEAATTNCKTQGVVAGKFDKSQTTTAKRRAFYNGSELTASATSGPGTVGTGAFDSSTWYAGGLPGSVVNIGPLNTRTFLIYESAVSDGDITSISTAIA